MGTLAQAMEAPFRLGTGTHTELSKVIGVNNKERGITRAAVASSSSSSSKQASKQASKQHIQNPDSTGPRFSEFMFICTQPRAISARSS